MKHPTKAQVQVVIDTLQASKDKVTEAGFEVAPVNMMRGVSISLIGKPMCHAAYYAITTGNLSFMSAANKMAEDLGFAEDIDLENWAKSNRELWGNANGKAMFFSKLAFLPEEEKLTDLQQIIDHWKGVQSRLPE